MFLSKISSSIDYKYIKFTKYGIFKFHMDNIFLISNT
jgi:hypothetical protein